MRQADNPPAFCRVHRNGRPLIGRPGMALGRGIGQPVLSGGVGYEFDDEVSIEGCADALQQGNRRHDTAGLQA
jgi:hypothetical protein